MGGARGVAEVVAGCDVVEQVLQLHPGSHRVDRSSSCVTRIVLSATQLLTPPPLPGAGCGSWRRESTAVILTARRGGTQQVIPTGPSQSAALHGARSYPNSLRLCDLQCADTHKRTTGLGATSRGGSTRFEPRRFDSVAFSVMSGVCACL